MIADAGTDPNNNGIHPDQHALVFLPDNPNVWFEGSDGGLMRSDGTYTDFSSQCATRGLTGDKLTTCQRLLSAVPTKLTSLNAGLDTLQFQSFSVNPKKPHQELLGGTQDNGTFLYEGSSVQWGQTAGGDGGQSGFNAANPNIRFHTYYAPQVFRELPGHQYPGLGLGRRSALHATGGGLVVLRPHHLRPQPCQGRQHLRRTAGSLADHRQRRRAGGPGSSLQ